MRVVWVFLILILTSFAMAGSELSMSFQVKGEEVEEKEVVTSGNFFNDYGEYLIGALFVLILVVAGFKKFGKGRVVKKIKPVKKKNKKKKRKSKKKKAKK